MEHGDGAAAMYAEMAAGRTSADDPASCSARGTMSTTTPPATAGTTAEARDELQSLPFDRYELGVDGEGSVHFHSARADRVVVVDERGDIEETFDLRDKRLSTYVAFVDDQRDWSTLNHAESFGEILLEALGR